MKKLALLLILPFLVGCYGTYLMPLIFEEASDDSGSTETVTSSDPVEKGPTLEKIFPNGGTSAGNTLVTLTGSGFSEGTPSVSLGGQFLVNLEVISDTEIRGRTPSGTSGSKVDVTVTNTEGSATLKEGFAYGLAPVFSGATSATATSASSIQLTWSAATDDTTQSEDIVYHIFQSSTSGGQSFSSATYRTEKGVTSFQVSSLQESSQYFFVVRAEDSEGVMEENTVEVSASTLTTTSSPSWQNTLENMSERRQGFSMVLLNNGKVLIAGGVEPNSNTYPAQAEIYDPSTGQFTATGSLNESRAGCLAVTLPSGKVLLAGGTNSTGDLNSAEIYNPATGQFTLTGSMSINRTSATGTLLNKGKVLVTGGGNGGSPLSSAEVYDPSTGSFSSTGSMAESRHAHTGTLLPSGKVFIAGGGNGTNALASTEIYDPSTGTFSTGPSLSSIRRDHSALLLNNGKVLIISGWTKSSVLNSADIYDPQSNTISPSSSTLNQPRREFFTLLLPNGKVLLGGGRPHGGFPFGSTEIYDPATDSFSSANGMNSSRHLHSAVLLPSGKVLTAGGNDGSGTALRSAEIYDPIEEFISTGSSMANARERHTATLLPSGEVLLAGGFTSGGSVTDRTEVYNPSTGQFRTVGNLVEARAEHTASLLSNGTVLIAGGNGGTGALTSAEIYNPSTESFSMLTASLNQARRNHGAQILSNGKVLLSGGQASSVLDHCELYDPENQSFDDLSGALTMNSPRMGHSLTLLKSGKVFLAGGTSDGSNALTSTEVFDPTTNAFSSTASLSQARKNHTAAFLPNEKVLLTGGESATSALNSAVLYTPSSDTFSAPVTMNTARVGHASLLLPSGEVLLVAGSDGSSLLSSTEVYNPTLNQFEASVSINISRERNTLSLLASGEVLIIGGSDGSSPLVSTEIYRRGLGFSTSWQPVISSLSGSQTFPTAFVYDQTLKVSGKRFLGKSENFSSIIRQSPANTPQVRLTRLASSGSNYQNSMAAENINLSAQNFTATSLEVTLPPVTNADAGYYMLQVIVNGIPSEGKIIRIDSILKAPVIGHISPPGDNLSGGGSITIDGSNFAPGFTSVTIGGTPATITSISNTQIVVTAPSGTFGKVDLTVTNTGVGSDTESNGFFYADSPTVTNILPNTGSTSGGESITIEGANFVDGFTTVTIGGLSLTGISINGNGDQITGNTPAGQSGPKNVVVETTGIGQTVVTGGFTYADPPTISSISPNHGSGAGGTSLAISGTNFSAGDTTVMIGGNSVTNLKVESSTKLTCAAPSGVGTVDVVVSTTGGNATLSNGYSYDSTPPTFGGVASATPTTESTIELQWNPATDNLSARDDIRYLVYFAESSGGQDFSSAQFITDPGLTRFTVPLLKSSIQYFFVVRAVDEAGNSENNFTEVSATISLTSSTSWVTTGSMSGQRQNFTMNLLPDGRILVAGGITGSGNTTIDTAEIYNPRTGNWSSISSMNSLRVHHSGTTLPNGKILIAGGNNNGLSGAVNSAEIFNPANETFTSLTETMSTTRAYHSATLLNNGKVLIAGGSNGSSLASAEIFDPSTNSFSPTGSLNQARFYHTAVLLPSGRVLIIGGDTDSGVTDSCEIYDPDTGIFYTTGSMNDPRKDHASVLMTNEKVIVAGGNNAGGYLATAEIYDPGTGNFTPTGSLSVVRREPTANLLPNGKVLFTGGRPPGFPYSSCEIYNPTTGTFSAAPNMNQARHLHVSATMVNGKVLVVGGNDGSGSALTSAELFDPSRGIFLSGPDMAERRDTHSVTVLPSGKLLIAGGRVSTTGIDKAEIYNPETNSFTATSNTMNIARWAHTSTLLDNGKVLIAGGRQSSTGFTNTCQLYDSSTNSFSNTDSMSINRARHSATQLRNGDILMAGGVNNSVASLASAELYDVSQGTFKTVGSLTTARFGHSAILLPDGKVMILGGYTGASWLNNAEIYDPSTETFSVLTSDTMATGRSNFKVELLPNGKVLIAGGQTSNTTSTNGAEIYDPMNQTFSSTGAMTTARGEFAMIRLLNGKVLVTGGLNRNGGLTFLKSAEVYDLERGAFSALPDMNGVRHDHWSVLLPNGRVMIIGGKDDTSSFKSTEFFDTGLGFSENWQPRITAIDGDSNFPVSTVFGRTITLGGDRFQGISEGTTSSTIYTALNFPFVVLTPLDTGSGGHASYGTNSQYIFLNASEVSDKSLKVTLPDSTTDDTKFPSGYYKIIIIVNGIPSRAGVIKVDQQVIAVVF